jgi:hypothetical protein
MAFILAKHWGVMPHVIWRYPFRYFKELRDYFIEASKPPDEEASGESFDWEDESLTGGPT